MTPTDIIDDMKGELALKRPRTYVGGLLPSFCDFMIAMNTPGQGFKSFADFIATHPLVTVGTSTLTVERNGNPDDVATIRPFYNKIHNFYLFKEKRIGYPRSEPYATGKWADYRRWLDALVTFSKSEIEEVRRRAVDHMLSVLVKREFDPSKVVVDPPVFLMLLEQFPWDKRAKGEPTGAAFQAMVFAYIRADAPHLQVETRKVRTGSAKLKGVGDVDAWEGQKLTISVEVKHHVFRSDDLEHCDPFVEEVRQRGALGMIVAWDFASNVADEVQSAGLVPLTIADLVKSVRLWDPVKQRAAMNAFEWAVVQKEQSPGLIERYEAFMASLATTAAI